MTLEGRAVIVTGASAGIGLAFTEALLRRGARVAGIARSADRLEGLRARLGEAFLTVPCDVRDGPAVRAAIRSIHETFARIDVLINNAGVGRFGPIEEVTDGDWHELLDTNVTGVFHATREVVPIMKEQGAGHIVNIGSIAGLVANPRLSGYNATKFALRGITEALFLELRDFGIKVTGMYPGSVDTEFSPPGRGATRKLDPAEVAEVLVGILERSENFLVSEIVIRPLKPRG